MLLMTIPLAMGSVVRFLYGEGMSTLMGSSIMTQDAWIDIAFLGMYIIHEFKVPVKNNDDIYA